MKYIIFYLFLKSNDVEYLMLSYEEMATVLSEIDAVLNSRPLCPLSSNTEDLNCLTPGNFLLGQPLTCLLETDVYIIPDNRLNFWQLRGTISGKDGLLNI